MYNVGVLTDVRTTGVRGAREVVQVQQPRMAQRAHNTKSPMDI